MKVSSESSNAGIRISIGKKEFSIAYPEKVWSALPDEAKMCLMGNIVYSRISPLASVSDEEFSFDTKKPALKSLLDKTLEKDLPRVAYEDSLKASVLKTNFARAKFGFSGDGEAEDCNAADSGSGEALEEGAVIGMSFGKDSLLSYALMRELGLKRTLVFFNDLDDDDVELQHKSNLIREFEKKFGEKIMIVKDSLDDIPGSVLKKEYHAVYGCSAMASYMLMSLPFAASSHLNMVLFGNEQNFNDFFLDSEGNKCYVSYEQSSDGMVELNKMLEKIAGRRIKLVSLVEPLYNLAEMKVLYQRYPDIAKFQMSCSHGVHEDKDNRWCQECPMCAKAFLYLAANNFSPKKAGFTKNLFDKSYWKMYPLFNPAPERIYEKPAAVRDEQLLAFFLAYKNGFKGALVDEFKKKYLGEAKEREEKLRKRFLAVQSSTSIPPKLLAKVKSIFEEELSK